MPVNTQLLEVYRQDVKARGRLLSPEERQRLFEPLLPSLSRSPSSERQKDTGPATRRSRRRGHRKRIRPFVKKKLYVLTYFLIHLVFGIYIRLRQIYHATFDKVLAILYYHHRTPDYIKKDVKDLSRIPEHLSVILTLKTEEDGGLEALIDEVAELCTWSAAVDIPLLSVYERTGILKSYMTSVHELVSQKLASYFGPGSASPTLRVLAPNHPSVTTSNYTSSSGLQTNGHGRNTNGVAPPTTTTYSSPQTRPHLNLLLLSAPDGRDTLVDLTRTLTEMSQSGKLSPQAITSDLINAEISTTTSLPTPPQSPLLHPADTSLPRRPRPDDTIGQGEPDLLIVFAPTVQLAGYPPWQIRLTEIFCVGDNGGDISGRSATRVEYQAFLRGLWKFAGAQMRFGR